MVEDDISVGAPAYKLVDARDGLLSTDISESGLGGRGGNSTSRVC